MSKRHPEPLEAPLPPRRPASLGAWSIVARAMHAEARTRERQWVHRHTLRTRLDLVADPDDLRRSRDQTDIIQGVHCPGDQRLAALRLMLDNFGVRRSSVQRLWHEHMINASLPHIYGERDWPRVAYRVMRQRGISVLKQEVLVQTFRRAGKTHCLAQLIAALLIHCPQVKIAIVSTGGRATGKLKNLVVQYLFQAPGASRRICGLTHEMLYVAAQPLRPGLTYRSPEAQAMQFLSSTNTLEAVPDNPTGKPCRLLLFVCAPSLLVCVS